MSRGNSGTFLFDPEAWRGSVRVQRMDPAERGLYLELLIEQWLKGTAPKTPEECVDRIGFTLGVWRAAWPTLSKCFRPRRNGLVNVRLEQTRKNKIAYLEGQAKRGSLGGKATQAHKLDSKRRSSGAQPPLKQNQANGVGLGWVNERSAAHAALPVEKSMEKSLSADNYRVILKIAHEVLNAFPNAPYADLVEGVKELCAKRSIVYDSHIVHKALDSAIAQQPAVRDPISK